MDVSITTSSIPILSPLQRLWVGVTVVITGVSAGLTITELEMTVQAAGTVVSVTLKI